MANNLNPYQFLPIKPSFTIKEIKKARKKYFKYHPDRSKKTNNEEINNKLKEEYTKFFAKFNSVFEDLEKGTMSYDRWVYEIYLIGFRQFINNFYSKEELEIILKENGLSTTGNKDILIENVLNNVPSEVAKLNLFEYSLFENFIKDNLESLENYQLSRILEIKGYPSKGTKTVLIDRIIQKISEDEIDQLVNDVKNETEQFKSQLKTLTNDQLKEILSNNDIKAAGTKSKLIDTILSKISFNEIDENIKNVSINIEEILEKFYQIIGKTKYTSEFKKTLKKYGLEQSHADEIKDEMISLINNYKISEKNLEDELIKLLDKKSKEVEEDALNELYSLIGKSENNQQYTKQLEEAGLDNSIGDRIREEIIISIKSKEIKKEDLVYIVNGKIKQAELKSINEKLELLYNLIGEEKPNKEFNEKLKENNLSKDTWEKIKNEIEDLIKSKSITKDQIETRANELFNSEIIFNMLNTSEIYELKQIAILNDFNIEKSKEKQINTILSNISSSYNIPNIKKDLSRIKDTYLILKSFYKTQLEYILDKSNLSNKGTKDKLIIRILSKLHLDLIKLYINEFEVITEKLNQTPLNHLLFLLDEKELKITGTPSKVVKDIIKDIPLNEIKSGLNEIELIQSKLINSNKSELKYIAESNNLPLFDDGELLLNEIQENLSLNVLKDNLLEIEEIKELLNSFNSIQRKHILLTNKLEISQSKEDQINLILENVDLKEIIKMNDRICNLKEKLESLNINQLHYIIEQNDLKISLQKEKQINEILENVIIQEVENNLFTLNKVEKDLSNLDNEELILLLENKKVTALDNKEGNIDKILQVIPIKSLINNLILIKKGEFGQGIGEINDSLLLSPLKEKNGKKALTLINHKNSILIPVFLEEEDYQSFVETKLSKDLKIHKMQKPLDYYKEKIKNNDRIDGILLKTIEGNKIIKN